MVRCLVINGTVGVGKTTTAEAIGHRWRVAGIPGAVIDVDWLRYAWPPPESDSFNAALGLANLASVVTAYVRQGAQALVLADVIEDAVGRDRQRVALQTAVPGLDYRLIRLVGDPATIRTRLTERHRHDTDGGIALRWHLERVTELAAVQDRALPDDAVVEVTGRGPDEVAVAVLSAAGWPT